MCFKPTRNFLWEVIGTCEHSFTLYVEKEIFYFQAHVYMSLLFVFHKTGSNIFTANKYNRLLIFIVNGNSSNCIQHVESLMATH